MKCFLFTVELDLATAHCQILVTFKLLGGISQAIYKALSDGFLYFQPLISLHDSYTCGLSKRATGLRCKYG